jgi:hypothetical protein
VLDALLPRQAVQTGLVTAAEVPLDDVASGSAKVTRDQTG